MYTVEIALADLAKYGLIAHHQLQLLLDRFPHSSLRVAHGALAELPASAAGDVPSSPLVPSAGTSDDGPVLAPLHIILRSVTLCIKIMIVRALLCTNKSFGHACRQCNSISMHPGVRASIAT
jgi:hypothetical protein